MIIVFCWWGDGGCTKQQKMIQSIENSGNHVEPMNDGDCRGCSGGWSRRAAYGYH